jgi:hypothetical protein
LLGYPNAREQMCALKGTREIGQAATRMFALGHAVTSFEVADNILWLVKIGGSLAKPPD